MDGENDPDLLRVEAIATDKLERQVGGLRR